MIALTTTRWGLLKQPDKQKMTWVALFLLPVARQNNVSREFNNLRNFSGQYLVRIREPCSTACGLGWVRSFGCSLASQLANGKPRTASTGDRVQATTPPPEPNCLRKAVLGAAASFLVFVENGTGRGFTRYCGALAPRWP
jgi:hypothetical protein